MRSLPLTLCTGLLSLAALTPVAHAADGGSVSLTPSSPAAGAEVALRVSGCAGRTATATSVAFVAEARLTGAGGTLAGETRVRASIEPGSYDVKIACADFAVKGRIVVVSGGSAADPTRHPASLASPTAPVQAGGGGTAHLAATDDRPAGPGTGHTVIGLILAAAAAVAVGLRSTRRSRGTD
ncbi:hypothetical protein [Streptomyces resistomycificus]|uniref:Membrane protein n=1 Tax=Streptomyces resistomycificus TaxID=67356 RepID=A0A0L8LD17_9ACTN|nr:hypothetical protein [Streptomyces resistomycificus]KOG36032.1 membrane protein [Streptomyces resistomycificus]KUN92389.1 hypothetical protein AQJ84_33440 [Streptomyces resistomycificus]